MRDRQVDVNTKNEESAKKQSSLESMALQVLDLLFEKMKQYESVSASNQKHETLVISNLYIWMSAFIDNRDALIKISNYIL